MTISTEQRTGGSPGKRLTAGGPGGVNGSVEIADDISEFSAITTESEIRTEENILDFKIENAEYYVNQFN